MGLVQWGWRGFPLFFAFFVFLYFSSLFYFFLCFFAFLCFSRYSPHFLLEQDQITAIYWKNGEFHSDPVCTDPVQNFLREFSGSMEWLGVWTCIFLGSEI